MECMNCKGSGCMHCTFIHDSASSLVMSTKDINDTVNNMKDMLVRSGGSDTVKVDTCTLCKIRTPEGMYYPSGEEDWYICDSCVDDMYPPKE